MSLKKPVVAAFDFDGTITVKDTFIPFLVSVFGATKVGLALASLALPGIRVGLGLASRDEFKALLIRKLFRGASVKTLEAAGVAHTRTMLSLCRKEALSRIKWHQQSGHRVVLVSASLNFYLEPMAKLLGIRYLLCTEVESIDGVCTGEMRGANCRAAEKVKRLESMLGALGQYEIYAYGDSEGDAEMLTAATYPAFMPFR